MKKKQGKEVSNMLISVKEGKWVDRYINLAELPTEEVLIKLREACTGYFEFCSDEEIRLVKRVLDYLEPAVKVEVLKAIQVYETTVQILKTLS